MAINSLESALKKLQDKLPSVVVDINSNQASHRKKVLLDSPRLNYVFGGGGLAYTRFHQFFGKESHGKTTLATAICGQLQRKIPHIIPGKEYVVYLDFERTFDPEWAKMLGMNTEKLILLHPDVGEDGAIAVEELIKSNQVCAVVLDSDAAMSSRSEFEDDVGKANFGASAKLMSMMARKFNILCDNYETAWIQISQVRKAIGEWSPTGLPPEKATGGDAVRFYAATRFKIQKVEELKRGTEKIGIKIKVKNIKNKTGLPWRECTLNLYFDGGFDAKEEYIETIVELSEDLPSIQRPSKVMYESEKYGLRVRGKDAFAQWLRDNEEAFEELKKEVDEVMKQQLSTDTTEEPDENTLFENDDIDPIEDTSSLANQALNVGNDQKEETTP